MTQGKTRCAALGLAAAAAVLTWQELAIRYHYQGNQTALFCTGSKQRIPPQFRDGTYVAGGEEAEEDSDSDEDSDQD